MVFRSYLLAVCAAWLAVVGCSSASGDGSSSSSSSSGGSSSGSSSGAGSGSGAASDSGSSSGSSTDGGGEGGGVSNGGVEISQCVGPSAVCTGPAVLFVSAEINFHTPCTNTTIGPCRFTNCTSNNFGAGDSAGALTVTGGTIPAGTTVPPASDNSYYLALMGTFVSAGDTISLTAAGSTVPAFGPLSLTAPQMITLTTPQLAADGSSVVPLASDLGLAWSGGQSGATTRVEIDGSGNNLQVLTCEWDASLGQGTIPKAALQQLGSQAITVTWGQEVFKTFTAGSNSLVYVLLPYTGQAATLQQ